LILRLTNTLKSRFKTNLDEHHEKAVNCNFNIAANHLAELSSVLLAFELTNEH